MRCGCLSDGCGLKTGKVRITGITVLVKSEGKGHTHYPPSNVSVKVGKSKMELERENGGIGELEPRRAGIRAQSSGRSDRYFHVDASGTFFFSFTYHFISLRVRLVDLAYLY